MKTAVKTSSVNMDERKALGIRSGDTVRVWQKIVETKKGKAANKKEVATQTTRLQAFEGLVLSVKHGTEAGSMFTVRKVASGVGVERIFPLYSPMIDKVEIVRRARVRRAKLYYIREKAAREVRRQMRRLRTVSAVASAETEAEALVEAAAQE